MSGKDVVGSRVRFGRAARQWLAGIDVYSQYWAEVMGSNLRQVTKLEQREVFEIKRSSPRMRIRVRVDVFMIGDMGGQKSAV